MYLLNQQRYGKPVIARAVNAWIDIEAPAPLIFRYLTEDEFLITWWSKKCQSEPRVGGKVVFEWDGEQAVTGEAIFREMLHPQRLVLQWTQANGEEIASDGSDQRGMRWLPLNIYELWQMDNSFTRIHLHDYGVGLQDKYTPMFDATCEGWAQALTRLKKSIERGRK